MDNFAYDKEIFLKNCFSSIGNKYNEMTKNQLIASMTIDYHRIEKGLAMQDTKTNFGMGSNVLLRIYIINKEYLKKI